MTILTAFCREAALTTEASYAIAWNIARSRHSNNDGEFTKGNVLQVTSILDPSSKKDATSCFPDGIVKANLYLELVTSVPMLQRN